MKQLLIYDRAVPVSFGRHGAHSVKAGADFSFSRDVNSVPLMAAEFESAADEFPIVFAGQPGELVPVAMLGLRDGENVYVDERGAWAGKYIPAFLRRYPFVFSASGDTFTLCVDESYPGFNTEGRGERLFDSDGERTQYLQGVLNFLQAYQAQFERTRALTARLEDLGLLEPMQAQFVLPSGQRMTLSGFLAVSRARLRALPGAELARLAQSEDLDAIYAHLHSLRNFIPTAERVAKALPPTQPQEPAAEAFAPMAEPDLLDA